AEGGVVSGGGVVFGMARSSLIEKPDGARGVVGGESRGVEGEDLGILMIKIWLENGDGEAMEKKVIYKENYAYEFLKYTPCKHIITARDVRLMRACFIRNSCWHALLTDTYSASVMEMARAVCFLENDKCMDKSKITRKQSKTSKHGHENQKSTKPKPRMSSPSQSPIQSPPSTHNKPQGPVLQ
ncbi:hypothetical protein Tco_1413404, partial [Tanacetum coccineum]